MKTRSNLGIDISKIGAKNGRMRTSRIIQFGFVALLCLGLAVPPSLLAGCCGCCRTDEQVVPSKSLPLAKSCCAGKTAAPQEATTCPPGSSCSVARTCPSCQAYQPVLIGEKQAPTLPSLDDQPLAMTYELAIPDRLIAETTADPPLVSHNARQSRICVWRK